MSFSPGKAPLHEVVVLSKLDVVAGWLERVNFIVIWYAFYRKKEKLCCQQQQFMHMIFSTSVFKPVISPLICAEKQRDLQNFQSDPLSAARSLPTAHRLQYNHFPKYYSCVWEFLSLPGSFCDRRYCYVAKNSFAGPVMRQKTSLTGQRQFLDPQIMTCTRHWLLSQHTSLRN